jgi:hypothetical protein
MPPVTRRNPSPKSGERSFAAPCTFTDEHIERWGAVYTANPQLRARGVLFETFLLAPVEILAACGLQLITVLSRPGLMPRQRDAQRRADTEAALRELGERAIAALGAEAHCANGTWTEKLRHHAHAPRRPAKRKLVEM